MTKIDIISGFLGAGKTTFIKKMIDEAFKGEQIVLIENEFGEVGIDGGFLKDAGIQITEMNSGCICCSLVGDFGKNLNEVITKYHPDRILIEPSGVGKLSDVMKSVIDIEKEQPVKLNALVTVVNALKASKQMKAFGEFFNNQIEYATTVILSRSQNATPEQLEFCVKQIQALNPKASVITTDWDAIKGEQILKTMEGQDNLEMKVLAEAVMHRMRQSIIITMTMTSMNITMTTTNMNITTTMMNMSTITSMARAAPVAVMTMIMSTDIIMLMMYLQAGARRHLTSLSALSSKKSLSSLWKMTRFSVQRAW